MITSNFSTLLNVICFSHGHVSIPRSGVISSLKHQYQFLCLILRCGPRTTDILIFLSVSYPDFHLLFLVFITSFSYVNSKCGTSHVSQTSRSMNSSSWRVQRVTHLSDIALYKNTTLSRIRRIHAFFVHYTLRQLIHVVARSFRRHLHRLRHRQKFPRRPLHSASPYRAHVKMALNLLHARPASQMHRL